MNTGNRTLLLVTYANTYSIYIDFKLKSNVIFSIRPSNPLYVYKKLSTVRQFLPSSQNVLNQDALPIPTDALAMAVVFCNEKIAFVRNIAAGRYAGL